MDDHTPVPKSVRRAQIEMARDYLISARRLAVATKIPNTAYKIRSALKSIDGALRHARRMEDQRSRIAKENT